MSTCFNFPARLFAGYLRPGLLIATLGLLSACVTTGKEISGVGHLSLAPGDTGNCDSNPCQVFLQIPAGSGSYEVTGNQVKIGVFPAGENADLGNLGESQVIEITGMEVPKTYVYVPSEP